MTAMFSRYHSVIRLAINWQCACVRHVKNSTSSSRRRPEIRNDFRSESGIRRRILSTSADVQSSSCRPEVNYSRLVTIPRRDGSSTSYSAAWLRENCRCPACYNSETDQRLVLFHHLPDCSFNVDSVLLQSESRVMITWSDGHESIYHLDTLEQAHRLGGPAGTSKHLNSVERWLWDATIMDVASLPSVKYHELVGATDAVDRSGGLKSVVANLLRYGFCLVGDAPSTLEATIAATNTISLPLRTLFGEHWTFGGNPLEYSDTAYTADEIGVHNDGTYFTVPPAIQVLHLLSHVGGDGGETVLVDGFNACDRLRQTDEELLSVLSSVRLGHQYIDTRRRLTYRSYDTILRLDPNGRDLEWIRYNPYDRMPLSNVEHGRQGAIYEALAILGQLLEDSTSVIRFHLRPGTILLMDNWRVLHGRTAYSGQRVLCGCYLSRDDWLNAARSAGLLND